VKTEAMVQYWEAGLEQSEGEMVSVCSLTADGEVFSIDTQRIREVLGTWTLHRMPLAPGYIAGVIPNRGAVLTTVSLRALLGIEEQGAASAVLVLEDADGEERFGLMVDSVGGVVTLNAETLEANPSTLGARGRALFDGAYKLREGLMVRLDTAKLCPSRLKEVGLFRNKAAARDEFVKSKGGQR
jgi:purine-binding chemotaxis protein CheW